jgi:hypothetical protein
MLQNSSGGIDVALFNVPVGLILSLTAFVEA